MHSSSLSGQALVALTGLLGFANAQGIYGSLAAELEQCRARFPGFDFGSEGFSYRGCFTGINTSPLFAFTVDGYQPTDYEAAFPNYNPGSFWDNTVTPLSCARACRGFGYKYTALINNQCRCGMQFPTVGIGLAATCTVECGGDSRQRCGGATAAQVYVDLSFASDEVIQLVPRNVRLAESYEYIGCYRTLGFVSDLEPLDDTVENIDDCFEACAGLGYPLVYTDRV